MKIAAAYCMGIWQYASLFTKQRIEVLASDLMNLISYNNNCAVELIKSQCFRYLIQIDRSVNLTYDQFAGKMRHLLKIEQIVFNKQRRFTMAKIIERYGNL